MLDDDPLGRGGVGPVGMAGVGVLDRPRRSSLIGTVLSAVGVKSLLSDKRSLLVEGIEERSKSISELLGTGGGGVGMAGVICTFSGL